MCRECLCGRVGSHPGLWEDVEECGRAESTIGWPVFSFTCEVSLGGNKSGQYLEVLLICHIPSAALLASLS